MKNDFNVNIKSSDPSTISYISNNSNHNYIPLFNQTIRPNLNKDGACEGICNDNRFLKSDTIGAISPYWSLPIVCYYWSSIYERS